MSGREKEYLVGVYLRLSKENRRYAVQNESDSISSQKLIAENYLKQHPELTYVDTYIDDGVTGLTYKRDEFQRLLDDLAGGIINTIITKDQSRFGREQIQTLQLLTLQFREAEIRYIAINDGIDTFVNPDMTIVQMKAFMNDYYSADGSRKVRLSQKAKRERGDFIGSFAPYGYLKNPENHSQFIIDPVTAPVVKRIFELYLGGYGQISIAGKLNEEGIPCPSVYKHEVQKLKYTNSHRNDKTVYWTYSTIHNILKHRVYAGDMVQHKIEKVAYNSEKKRKLKPEEWIIVPGTHEPIIPREMFDMVQQQLKTKRREIKFTESKYKSLFTGLFFCGNCGRAMAKQLEKKGDDRKILYKCSTYTRYGKTKCTIHSIRDEVLQKIILAEVKKNAIMALEQSDFDKIINSTKKKNSNAYLETIAKLQSNLESYKTRYENMLLKLSNNEISQQDYNIFKVTAEKKQEEIMQQINSLKHKLEEVNQERNRHQEWVDNFCRLKDLDALNRHIVVNLIRRIELYEDKSLKITFKFQNPFG